MTKTKQHLFFWGLNFLWEDLEMSEATMVWDNLNTAVVVSDPDFKVTYANQRAYDLFDELKIAGLKVGKNMAACHKPETMVKLKGIYQDFADKKIKVNYLTMDGPEGVLTIVNVPFYVGDVLGGVVEMVFESSLA
jgi:PAS domain-containing protein